jgi:hypothetical protein
MGSSGSGVKIYGSDRSATGLSVSASEATAGDGVAHGLVVGFDEHVHVRTLDAYMHDPKPLAQRRADRGIAYRLVQLAPP